MPTDAALRHDLEVFKIQRALYPTDGPCLFYDRSGETMFQLPMWDDLEDLFGADLKIYVLGRVRDGGIFEIEERVADREW